MYARAGERMVRTWRARDRRSTVVDCSTMHSRPWMYGYPVPAWFEAKPKPIG
jgi:hypothetical protein